MKTTKASAVVLTCHAPHADPRKVGVPCGRTLWSGRVNLVATFITTADRRPDDSDDGDIWHQCPKPSCGKWNRFRVVIEAGRLV